MTSPTPACDPAPLPPAPSRRLWWIAGWAVLAALFAVAAYALPWSEILAALAGARWQWIAVAVVAGVAGWPFWILQWWLLAPAASRPSLSRMAQVTALTGTANVSLPMAGVVAAVGFLIMRGRLAPVAAASVYAVDQLVTGIAKVAILALAAVLVPVPDWLRAGLLSLSGVILVLTVLLAVAAHGGNGLRRIGTGLGEKSARFVGILAHFVDQLEPMRRPLLGLAVILLAFAKKASEVAVALAVQVAVGIEPSLAGAVLVVAALSLATLAPISPGNLGIYEATVIFAYQYLGVPLPLAAAAAFLQHGVTFATSLLIALYPAWAMPREDRDRPAA